VQGDAARYLHSIAAAAREQSRQVRDLIGDRHWLSDGKHKEALISSIISRHCPSGVLVTSGFVLHPSDMSLCSREQDVLILDTTREAPLFQSAGFAVALPDTVLGAVSVKTKFARTELSDACDTLNSLLHVLHRAGGQNTVWSGAFCFEAPSPIQADSARDLVRRVLEEVPPPARSLAQGHHPPQLGVAAIATLQDLLVNVQYSDEPATARAVGYNTGGLACALFLAELMDHIATRRGSTEASVLSFADQLESNVLFDCNVQNLPAQRL
jgi:hypothetical protein